MPDGELSTMPLPAPMDASRPATRRTTPPAATTARPGRRAGNRGHIVLLDFRRLIRISEGYQTNGKTRFQSLSYPPPSALAFASSSALSSLPMCDAVVGEFARRRCDAHHQRSARVPAAVYCSIRSLFRHGCEPPPPITGCPPAAGASIVSAGERNQAPAVCRCVDVTQLPIFAGRRRRQRAGE